MKTLNGKVGLGFRRDIAEETLANEEFHPDFLELAPENWMGMGGYFGRLLAQAAEKFPLVCHGLSLSLGSPDPLNWDFIKELKAFLDEYKVQIFSEHLSFNSCNNAHFYDLLPIPFRDDAILHVAERIRQVQDYLERPIAIENVSYYTPIAAEMPEHEFISLVVDQSGCQLLLDVNNVYVNSVNHSYNSKEFIENIPLGKVAYLHMAGHKKVEDDLIIDTHGEAIIDPVFELLDFVAAKTKAVPVLLERDFNFEDKEEIRRELSSIKSIVNKNWLEVEPASKVVKFI
jgi:uncharacterized protein (UPF0276 family)